MLLRILITNNLPESLDIVSDLRYDMFSDRVAVTCEVCDLGSFCGSSLYIIPRIDSITPLHDAQRIELPLEKSQNGFSFFMQSHNNTLMKLVASHIHDLHQRMTYNFT